MRSQIVVIGLATLLGVAPCAAQQAPAGTAEAPKDDNARQFAPGLLSFADRLTIKIRGYPELSGDYRVGTDETVSIPVIGRVSISKLDAAGLEKILSAKVVQITGKEGFVTVEIAAYRPMYVTGYVKNPGAIQWQPGLTVLQAVALSGGTLRDAPVDERGEPTRQAESRNLVDEQKRTLAALARARAEQQGADDIKVPPELIALAGAAEANEIIGRERTIFRSRRTSFENQMATLESSLKLAAQELDGLKTQSVHISDQLRVRRDYMKKIQELVAKGVVLVQRGMEEEIKVSDLEEKITNISVSIARVQGTIGSVRREMAALKGDRETSIQNDISKLERLAARQKNELNAMQQNGLVVSGPDAPKSELKFQVVRRRAEGAVTLRVDQFTPLEPDDVLVVVNEF